ncbi:YciI family protein [Blastococcus brunescens]|uniref:YciI family protein n=1 Tax=Blastococcus brunescens TaxID=1564165 RepID=A0ABZ1B9F7_9ACTN|nr:YciI family protein [Blastococcus sp. BMG 8361]WRL66468.1 YciI family protein [Blastococcus sp. BMG 8361]
MGQSQMELQMARLGELEADMRARGSWLFSGRLTSADTATVVRQVDGRRVVSDGPFIESKEHLGGFYVIDAADLDEALGWADRTVAAIGMPIEVWPFVATAGGQATEPRPE